MNELNDLPEVVVEEIPLEEAPADEPQEETPPVDEKPDVSSLEEQVKALEEKRKKLEEDAKYWRQQKIEERARFFKEKKGESTPIPPADVPGLGPAPNPADFDDYNEYVDKKTKYEVTQARLKWEAEEQRRKQDEVLQQKEADLQLKLQRGLDKYEDFEDAVFDETVPITPTVKDILMDCDNPEDVAYYLSKNRATAIRISRLSPYQAAREIAKIELGLGQSPPVQKKTTNAPPPIKPLGSSHTVNKDPNKMTQAEFNRWRESHGAKPY